MRKPCCDKQDTNKGAWSKLEDQKLIDYIQKHGEGCWNSLAQAAGILRCGKSCRLRWVNYLRPDLKRGNFAEDEEDLIIKLHSLLGNRWSLIAGRLPGRTDNEVKNYWNSHLRRKLIQMGIDPNNHRLNQTTHSSHLPTVKLYNTATSSTPKIQQGMKEKVSDATNCVEDESCILLPDLNLNVNIPFHYMEEEEEENPNCKSNKSRDQMGVAHNSSNALLLFR